MILTQLKKGKIEAKLKHVDEVNLNRNSRTENIKSEKQDKTYESRLNENNFACQEQNENNLIYQELNDKSPIYRELKEYRLNKSRKENIKAYAIYSNSELEEIIKKKPKTVGELRLINVFGNFRCNKYGEDIINIVKIYCE
jgi:superfamily II DNA helicase RecQ